MDQDPLVSVVLPVYNGARYLHKALESMVNQTYHNLEIIVINDASTDNSLEIAESFKDPRIKIVNNERNLGLVGVLNKGISFCTGAYIARMDADDISLPTRIEKQLCYFQQYPDVAMVDTVMLHIDEDDNPTGETNSNQITEKQIKTTLPFTNCLGHPSAMFRRDVYLHYQYRKVECEDYDLWLRLLNDGQRIHKINEALVLYRLHSTNMSSKRFIKRRIYMADTKMFHFRSLSLKDKLRWMNIMLFSSAVFNYVHGYIRKWIIEAKASARASR
jgi:glycosyltransferase involved in cell wall biosynthesis